jgi:hypothetical protein
MKDIFPVDFFHLRVVIPFPVKNPHSIHFYFSFRQAKILNQDKKKRGFASSLYRILGLQDNPVSNLQLVPIPG